MIYSFLLVLERSSTNTAAEQQFHGFYRAKMVFTGEESAYIITNNISFVARPRLKLMYRNQNVLAR